MNQNEQTPGSPSQKEEKEPYKLTNNSISHLKPYKIQRSAHVSSPSPSHPNPSRTQHNTLPIYRYRSTSLTQAQPPSRISPASIPPLQTKQKHTPPTRRSPTCAVPTALNYHEVISHLPLTARILPCPSFPLEPANDPLHTLACII